MINKKREIILSIVVVIIALISFIIINNNKLEEKQKEEDIVNREDYSYLIKNLFTFIYDIGDYYENKMNNIDKLTVAILNAKEIEDSTVSYDDVVKSANKLFGKNNNINFMEESDGLFTYNKETKEYEVVPMGVTYMSFPYYIIDSVLKDNDKLEIILNVGSVVDIDNKDISKICYDYDFNKLNSEGKCEHIENNKYYTEYNFNSEKYMKENKEKFSKYKVIFTNEDNNYIYNKIEKVK